MPKILLYKARDVRSHKEIGKALSALPEAEYVIEIKKKRQIRSLSQNRYYRFILTVIAGKISGHTTDELHEAFKLKFNGKMINFPKGGSQMIGGSTAIMETDEFTAYINRVKLFALEEFGIEIPEAGEVTNQHEMQAENDYEMTQSGY